MNNKCNEETVFASHMPNLNNFVSFYQHTKGQRYLNKITEIHIN